MLVLPRGFLYEGGLSHADSRACSYMDMGDEPEGSVVIVAAEGRLIGIFTERDVLTRVAGPLPAFRRPPLDVSLDLIYIK